MCIISRCTEMVSHSKLVRFHNIIVRCVTHIWCYSQPIISKMKITIQIWNFVVCYLQYRDFLKGRVSLSHISSLVYSFDKCIKLLICVGQAYFCIPFGWGEVVFSRQLHKKIKHLYSERSQFTWLDLLKKLESFRYRSLTRKHYFVSFLWSTQSKKKIIFAHARTR